MAAQIMLFPMPPASFPVGDQVMYLIIDLPVPPLCADHPDYAIRRGERIVIELIDGRKLIGRLMRFDADKGHIAVDLEGVDKHKNLGMHELRLLRIPQPRPWHNDAALSPGDSEPQAMTQLDFTN